MPRSQLQLPHRGRAAHRQAARALRHAVARVRQLGSPGPPADQAVDLHPPGLVREPGEHAPVPAVPRAPRGRRGDHRRALERLLASGADRPHGRGLRDQHRAAQLLQPPGRPALAPSLRGAAQRPDHGDRHRRRRLEGIWSRAPPPSAMGTSSFRAVPAGAPTSTRRCCGRTHGRARPDPPPSSSMASGSRAWAPARCGGPEPGLCRRATGQRSPFSGLSPERQGYPAAAARCGRRRSPRSITRRREGRSERPRATRNSPRLRRSWAGRCPGRPTVAIGANVLGVPGPTPGVP